MTKTKPTVPKSAAAPDSSSMAPPHDRRGHNGSTRGRKDMAGRKHKGNSTGYSAGSYSKAGY